MDQRKDDQEDFQSDYEQWLDALADEEAERAYMDEMKRREREGDNRETA